MLCSEVKQQHAELIEMEQKAARLTTMLKCEKDKGVSTKSEKA